MNIRDIAYDIDKENGYTVYIQEGDLFEPYLVLSSDYNGNVLLLREYLLADAKSYNENEKHMWSSNQYGGYYEDSSIDVYLNSQFINIISQAPKNSIVSSEIVITDKSSLGVTGDKTKTISRNVFLLSLNELDGAKSKASAVEGDTLNYFADDYKRRIACFANGEDSAYWTRTPETWETYNVFTIGVKGIGAGSADIESGVRPAFCLDKSTAITQRTDIIIGETVYVIE